MMLIENDKRLKDMTNLEIDDIMELLEFVVTTTYYTCRGVIVNCSSPIKVAV